MAFTVGGVHDDLYLTGMNRKEIVSDFLMRAARGDSREAFELYVSSEFKHHNAYFPGDAESLIVAMDEAARNDPDKVFEIQRIIEEGDLLMVPFANCA